MAFYSEMNLASKDKFLGTDKSVTEVLLNGAKITLHPQQQTLILGLGGSGTQTVNRIKGELAQKYSWPANKIAFLAMDTSKGDLNLLRNLDASEKYEIPNDAGIANRHNNVANRLPFTNEWIYPNFHQAFDGAGAGQCRQICHAKMFDKPAGAMSVDQILQNRIGAAVNSFMATYVTEVIIVLGVAGGTGSGGLINIAHFVRRALSHLPHKITGYFFMPDVFDQHDGMTASKNANGYAALKELDYYFSIGQRSENDLLQDNNGFIAFNRLSPLYDMAFLVSGSVGGATANSYDTALGAAAEFITNLLTEDQAAISAAAAASGTAPVFLMSSFGSNLTVGRNNRLADGFVRTPAGTLTGAEMPGFYGEDVYKYCGIGVGVASFPMEEIKAYAIDRVGKVISNHVSVAVPSAAFSNVCMPPVQAASEIKKLLQCTPQYLKNQIQGQATSLITCPTHYAPDGAAIVGGGAKTDLHRRLGIDAKQDTIIKNINNIIDDAYRNFETSVKSFLKINGPRTFRDIWNGTGPANTYDGMLAEVNKCAAVTMNQLGFSVNAKAELDAATAKVASPIWGLLDRTKADWVNAALKDERVQLAYFVATNVYGPGNSYETLYLNKVRALCKEVCEFAEVLDALLDNYAGTGTHFSTLNDFSAWQGNHTNASHYNLLIGAGDYTWAKTIVDAGVSTVNYAQVRDDLIDDFMAHRNNWISDQGDETARDAFDRIMAPYFRFTDKINIVDFIMHTVNDGGNVTSAAINCVNGLVAGAVPMFASTHLDPTAICNRYLLVPKGIFAGASGPNVKAAFTSACAAHNIEMTEVDGADKLVLYTQAAALPIYALDGLEQWEKDYNAVPHMIHRNESGKGDFDPTIGLEWKNYPSLVHNGDPRLPDSAGHRSAEGDFLVKEFDPLFNEALQEGIIRERQDNSGRYYYEYSNLIHLPAWDLSFDAATWPTDADGLLLKGQDLFAHLAQVNGSSLAAITKPILLGGQGAFSDPNPIQKNALDWAKRSLRKNVPMYLEVKKTLAAVKALIPAIDAENAKRWVIINKKKEEEAHVMAWLNASALVPKYIACGLLVELNPVAAEWDLLDANTGSSDAVTNLKAMFMDGDDLNRKRLMAGLTYPALVGKFMQYMQAHGEIDFNTAYKPVWDAMLQVFRTGDITMHGEFKARLQGFVQEAKTFLANHDGPAKVIARGTLLKQLDAEDKYDLLLNCYQAIINEDKNL